MRGRRRERDVERDSVRVIREGKRQKTGRGERWGGKRWRRDYHHHQYSCSLTKTIMTVVR